MKRLKKGYKEDNSELLDIICLIELYPDIDNSNYIAEALLHG